MTTPRRIQRKRTKGWRMPEGAVYVGRPSRYGNPYRIGAPHPWHGWPMTRQDTVVMFAWATSNGMGLLLWPALRGKDLVCWCSLSDPCHADVLLELANR